MGLSKIDRAILAELRKVEGNLALRSTAIMEWSTGPFAPHEGEKLVFLPELKIHVAYKLATRK